MRAVGAPVLLELENTEQIVKNPIVGTTSLSLNESSWNTGAAGAREHGAK